MNNTTLVTLSGTAEDMRQQFERFISSIRPEPNKLQKALYGEENLATQSDEMIRKLVTENHGMGNTTAKVLRNIANAIEARGKSVAIEFEAEQGTGLQQRQFREYMCKVIDRLDLKFMYVSTVDNTIKLDI